MYQDEIIAEVWRNRDSYAKTHNFNLDEIVADLRRREQSHPERLVDRSDAGQEHARFRRQAPNRDA
jgi:hypothetical protein